MRLGDWRKITDAEYLRNTLLANPPRSAAPLDSMAERVTISALSRPLRGATTGSVSLSGQNTLRIRSAADGSPTYAQIVITGDMSTSGQGMIELDPGVHVRVFVVGDVDITGNGIHNPNSTVWTEPPIPTVRRSTPAS